MPRNFPSAWSVLTLQQTQRANAPAADAVNVPFPISGVLELPFATCLALPKEQFMHTAITTNNPLFRNPRSDVHCKDWLQGTPFCWHALLGLNSPGSRSATVDQKHLEPYSSTFPYHISNLSSVLPRSLTPVGPSKMMAVPKGHSDYTHSNICNKCWELLSAENAVSNHVTRIVQFFLVIKAESIRKECEDWFSVS